MNTFISIVGILLLVAGVVGTVISVTMKKQVIRKLGIAGLIVGLVFILIGSAFVIILVFALLLDKYLTKVFQRDLIGRFRLFKRLSW